MIKTIYENKKLLLFSIFLASFFVSFLFLFFWGNLGPQEHAVPGTDYQVFYEPVANNILGGKGLTLGGDLALRYPPGYPVILAAVFALADWLAMDRFSLIVVFNMLMAALSACFLFLLAELIVSKKVALIASFLWLSYPLSLWFLKNPNTEPPFILFLFSALWFFISGVKRRSLNPFLICGVLIGLASLIRPVSILLPFLLAILIFFLIGEALSGRKVFFGLALLAAFLLVVSPWLVYVFLDTGKIIPLSTGGALSVAGGLTMMVDGVREDSLIVLPDDVVALIDRSRAVNRDSSSDAFIFLAKEMVGHPLAFFKLLFIKAARSWYATSEMWWEKQLLLLQLVYLLPGAAGIYLAFKKRKEKSALWLFLLLVIFYFWLATIVALSIVRYLVPAMGLLMIFSALSLEAIFNRFRNYYGA